MKNKDLIEALSKFPLDQEVCIFDYKQAIFFASEDPTAYGVYPDFKVEHRLSEERDPEYMKEVFGIEIEPFIALSFSNEDYDKDSIGYEK